MAEFMAKNSFSLPPRNKFLSRKEWEETCWKRIIKSEKGLDSLVTANERRNIVMRAAVMNLINSGRVLRQISRELQISRQTISSIKKAIKEKSYRSYWERSKTERKKKTYSRHPSRKKNFYRYYRRTKYGKVYLPY